MRIERNRSRHPNDSRWKLGRAQPVPSPCAVDRQTRQQRNLTNLTHQARPSPFTRWSRNPKRSPLYSRGDVQIPADASEWVHGLHAWLQLFLSFFWVQNVVSRSLELIMYTCKKSVRLRLLMIWRKEESEKLINQDTEFYVLASV
jgi:hypothetical protein